MNTIGIQANIHKPAALEAAKTAITILLSKSIRPVVEKNTALAINQAEFTGKFDQCDAVIVIGGDGTILRTVRLVYHLDIPIFGVNLGHVGFLSEVEPHELEKAIDKIISNQFTRDARSLLSTTHHGQSFVALNDFTLYKVSSSHLIKLDIFIDEKHVCNYSCDGIIISTATGSTAYSLSAGGPLVHPNVPATIITPICPHLLRARPMVVAQDSFITLSLQRSTCSSAQISADGDIIIDQFEPDQILSITAHPRTIDFIRLKEYNFFELIMQKL